MSNLVVRSATLEDLSAIEELRTAAFDESGDSLRVFPGGLTDPEGLQQFLLERIRKNLSGEDPTVSAQIWMVAEDSVTRKLAAVMRYEKFEDVCAKPQVPIIELPFAGPDSARFFNELTATRRELMGSQLHYYVHLLAAHPRFQRRGAARALMSHLFTIANSEDTTIYLESSQVAVPVYKRLGFKEMGRTIPFPCAPGEELGSVVSTIMIKEPES
ncbi:acyl-CoA N-acyltransferase [Auriculariales sp. MPI-PUGE-AT-0066]|nr:acyl-CoA N-acyltransferase [Auriculariales sp. MPI-PUGE-AT-0066]